MPGAKPMLPRSQRPLARNLAPYRGGASHAGQVARAGLARPLPATPPDHRTALWANQTTRRLSPLDGLGTGSRANPMVLALCDLESADTLQKMAARRGGPSVSRRRE